MLNIPAGLLAVHGKKRAGKGAVADYLVRHHSFTRIKFSAALKDMISSLLIYLNVPEHLVERCMESDLKELPLACLAGKSTRYLMQTIGTEWRDLIHHDLWLNITLREARNLAKQGERLVLDDFRFEHERLGLTAYGASLWMVKSNRKVDFEKPLDIGNGFDQAASFFDFDTGAIHTMTRALLNHCSLTSDEIYNCIHTETGRNIPISSLYGWTTAQIMKSLDVEWRELMNKDVVINAAATANHISEQSLDESLFNQVFTNNSSLADLEFKIEQALVKLYSPLFLV